MRNSLKLVAATLALGALAFGPTVANANPISMYYSFDGMSYTQIGATNPTGSNTFSGSVGTFGVQLNVTGTGTGPFSLPQPGFDTNTITVSSSTGGTIYLASVETGLTDTNVGYFTIGFTNNSNSSVPVTESFYVGTALTFTSPPLATAVVGNFPGSGTQQTVAAPALTSPYQIAEMYAISFGSTGGSVNATISERAVVPEPLSISILGAGLAGVGLVRSRRKSKS